MKIRFAVALASLLSLAPVDSFACGSVGWANPDSSVAAIKLDEVIVKAKLELGIAVAQAELQYRCGSDINYSITDLVSGQSLGTVPVPSTSVTENDGRAMTVRLAQLLKTPREQLIALRKSATIFRNDVDGLEEDLGIAAYVPSAIPLAERIKNNAQDYSIYLIMQMHCEADGYVKSPYLISQSLTIKTLEYIPGRVDYPASSIYQKGDFKKLVFSSPEVLAKIKSQVTANAKYCRRHSHQEVDWLDVSQRFERPLSEVMKTAPERFGQIKAKATDAYMLNENHIAVVYPTGEKRFAGTIDEMVEIQALLSAQGRKVDKHGRLDWKGKIGYEVVQEGRRSLPASLQ